MTTISASPDEAEAALPQLEYSGQEYLDMMQSVRHTDLAFKKPRYEDHHRAVMDSTRCAHEGGHFKQQRRNWNHAPMLLAAPTQPLSLLQYHDFCWKTCALYSTTEMVGDCSDDLINYIWVKWFHGDATDIDNDEFVVKHIKAYAPECPKSLPEIIDAHRTICVEVQRQDRRSETRESSLGTPGEQYGYRFLPSFKKVFIIVDSSVWYRDGVILVFSDKLPGFDIETETMNLDVPEFAAGDHGRAVRISLEKAIRLVMRISDAITR